MAVLLRPLNPTLARQIHAGVVMETTAMAVDHRDTRRRFPSIVPMRWADVVQRDYVGSPGVEQSPRVLAR